MDSLSVAVPEDNAPRSLEDGACRLLGARDRNGAPPPIISKSVGQREGFELGFGFGEARVGSVVESRRLQDDPRVPKALKRDVALADTPVMRRLNLYDTLSREKRSVVPMDNQTLRFHCCGPTVYGPAHIGNFRTFVMQDIFRRVVEATGLKTRHLRNLTDVDDKTIRQSQEAGVPLAAFTAGWTRKFHDDCAALHLLEPTIEPSAVGHIPEQIELIQRLEKLGHAYRGSDGSVYFRVGSFEEYGRLSRLDQREVKTTETDRNASDEYDRDSAADFALWKARRAEDGANYWESPWGEGRPGWHLECSAMAMKHLGESFDLHSGGVDLVFPHHENEIAQSEAATGKPFVRHWFHIAHLMVHGQKMSKSLGNLYTLEDLREEGFSAEETRYVLQSGSYRQPLNFTFESLKAARKALGRLREFHRRIGGSLAGVVPSPDSFGPFDPVLDALLDDLNTPEALGQLFGVVKALNAELDRAEPSAERLETLRQGFAQAMRVLGLTLEVGEADGNPIPSEVAELAQQRWDAKRAKDWSTADALRQRIQEAGWRVKDEKDSYALTPLD